jgi:hypothetical protein
MIFLDKKNINNLPIVYCQYIYIFLNILGIPSWQKLIRQVHIIGSAEYIICIYNMFSSENILKF